MGRAQVLLRVLRDGNGGMRQRAMDVLVAAVQHDAQPLRDFLCEAPEQQHIQLLLRCAWFFLAP
jgi:hypothetical protein